MLEPFTNYQNDPYLSEPSEEAKNRNSIISTNSKNDFYELNLYTKIEALVVNLKSDLQISLFRQKELENILKFQSSFEQKLELIQKKIDGISSDNCKHYENIEKKFAPFELRLKAIEQKLEKGLEMTGNCDQSELSEKQRILMQKEMMKVENKEMSRVIKRVNEKLETVSAARDKFMKLFYVATKKNTEYDQRIKEILIEKEEEGKKVQELIQENRQFEELINEQDKEIMGLKEMNESLKETRGRSLDHGKIRNFSGFLRKSNEQVNEIKSKLETLCFKIVEKVESLENRSSEEGEKMIFDEMGKDKSIENFELMRYLKNYSEVIQNQIDELEGLEKELDQPENFDDLLRRFNERHLSDDRLMTEILTISSDEDSN